MWVPKEVVDELNEEFPNASLMALKGAWDFVAISAADMDETAREFAEVAVKSSTTSELVIAGVGNDGASFVNAARSDVELLVISESELSVIECWLGNGAASSAPLVPSLRDRLGGHRHHDVLAFRRRLPSAPRCGGAAVRRLHRRREPLPTDAR